MRSPEKRGSPGTSRRRRPRPPSTASVARFTSAPISTASSNAMMTKGGMDTMGLPPVTSGQARAVPMHSAKPHPTPISAPERVMLSSTLRGRASARTSSGKGAGIAARTSAWPAARSATTAPVAVAGSANTPSTPSVDMPLLHGRLLHLGDRDRGQEAHENEEPEEEPAEGAHGDGGLHE